MIHDQKVARLRSDLKAKGISAWTSAPPAFRLCWRCGLNIRPPHFQSFLSLAAVFGIYFGLFWGIAMWFMVWRWRTNSDVYLWICLEASIFAGLLFGLSIATYYRRQARRLGLPSWDRYPAA